jgi:hypothetical protein
LTFVPPAQSFVQQQQQQQFAQQQFVQQQQQQQYQQQVNAASASREAERLEPCVQHLTDAVANALRLEPRLARALVASCRSLGSVRMAALALAQQPAAEAAVARQLYQKWSQIFLFGYQPSAYLADATWWAAAGEKKPAKSASGTNA